MVVSSIDFESQREHFASRIFSIYGLINVKPRRMNHVKQEDTMNKAHAAIVETILLAFIITKGQLYQHVLANVEVKILCQ